MGELGESSAKTGNQEFVLYPPGGGFSIQSQWPMWWPQRCVKWAEDLSSLQADIPWAPVVQASLQVLEILSGQEIQGAQESLSPPVKIKKNEEARDSYPATHCHSAAFSSQRCSSPASRGHWLSLSSKGSRHLLMYVHRLQSDARVL